MVFLRDAAAGAWRGPTRRKASRATGRAVGNKSPSRGLSRSPLHLQYLPRPLPTDHKNRKGLLKLSHSTTSVQRTAAAVPPPRYATEITERLRRETVRRSRRRRRGNNWL